MAVANSYDELHVVPALAEEPVLQMGIADRVMSRVARVELAGEPEGQAMADLAGDAFNALYQADPQFRADVPAARSVNQRMIAHMQGTHGWDQSRAHTAGNLPAAMHTAGFMWSAMTSDDNMKKALQEQEKADQAQQAADEAGAQSEALRDAAQALWDSAPKDSAPKDSDRQRADELAQEAGRLQKKAQRLQKKADEAAQKADEAGEKATGSMLTQARMMKAAQDGAKQAKEVAQAAAGWGQGPGSPVQTDPAAAREFLKRNAGKIAHIAQLAGRLRGVAMQAKQTRLPVGLLPSRVGLTRDVTHLFTSELALLRPDAPTLLRAEAVGRLVDSGLLGWQKSADADKRGPFVAAVDVSPSMRGPREIVAKAVALGVAQTARLDGRPYILFSFASDPTQMLVVRHTDSWQQHIVWAEHTVRGGTDFNMAIAKAIELLGDIDRADCLFISDGEAGVKQETAGEWRKFQDQTGARMFYVPVGRGGYLDIERLADRVVETRELDEGAGTDLAKKLGAWI